MIKLPIILSFILQSLQSCQPELDMFPEGKLLPVSFYTSDSELIGKTISIEGLPFTKAKYSESEPDCGDENFEVRPLAPYRTYLISCNCNVLDPDEVTAMPIVITQADVNAGCKQVEIKQ